MIPERRLMTKGLAFLSSLQASREARVSEEQKEREIAKQENIPMSVMAKEILEATIWLEKDFITWYRYG